MDHLLLQPTRAKPTGVLLSSDLLANVAEERDGDPLPPGQERRKGPNSTNADAKSPVGIQPAEEVLYVYHERQVMGVQQVTLERMAVAPGRRDLHEDPGVGLLIWGVR